MIVEFQIVWCESSEILGTYQGRLSNIINLIHQNVENTWQDLEQS